ncbi:hypothetical protein J4467_02725 [Candidatus Woesearchaeota archaeon]|nr:hypothetical protein [Candidatus Woesearchaeota archaeon]
MLKLDGNYLEGEEQIVQTALALSILTQKTFTINNIRANKPNIVKIVKHFYHRI